VARDHNREVYERRPVAGRYASRSDLQPAEAAILRRYAPEVAGGRILDLGVGGGRTTASLLELSSDYVGVDYSHKMIELCRGRFPSVQFHVGDARDLSDFSDSSFDFVLFSYNGIDEVDHLDRLAVLGEIHRIIKPGGLFAFSSHNRNFQVPKPWDWRHLAVDPLRHPVRFGKQVISYPIGIVNYLRQVHRAQEEEEYRMAVDMSYRYVLVHYHITIAAQQKQLEAVGFGGVEALGSDGRWLSPAECKTIDEPWIHYVCRRT
jgi:ubiquinone/menaquinone biosynthesis C-methylase UbiE